MSRNQLDVAFNSDDTSTVCSALISAAYFDPDGRWVEQLCLKLLESDSDLSVRRAAVTALGHLARIHQEIDVERVVPALTLARERPELRAYVDDTLSDIKIFVFGETTPPLEDEDTTSSD